MEGDEDGPLKNDKRREKRKKEAKVQVGRAHHTGSCLPRASPSAPALEIDTYLASLAAICTPWGSASAVCASDAKERKDWDVQIMIVILYLVQNFAFITDWTSSLTRTSAQPQSCYTTPWPPVLLSPHLVRHQVPTCRICAYISPAEV